MDFGNKCALLFRTILVALVIFGIVLSSMVMEGCLLVNARGNNSLDYGVGLKYYQNMEGSCVDHSTYIHDNYNGMEVAAKICGIVAPCTAAVFVLILIVECFTRDVAGGWFIPGMLMLGSLVCQGCTFLIFESDLFCKGDHIQKCVIGDTGYRNIQACVVYGISLVIFYFTPTPDPISVPMNRSSTAPTPASEPAGEGDYTKEMYEQRRKEKKIKAAKGESGRSKRESEKRRSGRGDRSTDRSNASEDEYRERDREKGSRDIVRYNDGSVESSRRGKAMPKHYDDATEQSSYSGRDSGRGRRSKGRSKGASKGQRYDDYVEEPDGMDWSAYSSGEREMYFEKKQSKKSSHRRDSRPPPSRNDSRYSEREYDNSYYDDQYGDSRYSDRDERGVELRDYQDKPSVALVTVDDDSRYEPRRERSRSSGRHQRSSSRGHRDDYSYEDDYSRGRDDTSYIV